MRIKHFRAQERLSVTQKTGEREIARLTALLRKSEMSVASMEDKIKLKVYRYTYIKQHSVYQCNNGMRWGNAYKS